MSVLFVMLESGKTQKQLSNIKFTIASQVNAYFNTEDFVPSQKQCFNKFNLFLLLFLVPYPPLKLVERSTTRLPGRCSAGHVLRETALYSFGSAH